MLVAMSLGASCCDKEQLLCPFARAPETGTASSPDPTSVPTLRAERNGLPGKDGASSRGARAHLLQDLPLVEPHEARLVGPHLVDADVVVAGVDVLRDGGPVPLGIGSADDRLGHPVLGDQLGYRLEMRRQGQLPR